MGHFRRGNTKENEMNNTANSMSKMYTARGDKGETDLMGGERVYKDDIRVVALGELDELNATIGLAITTIKIKDIRVILHRIQDELFTAGADLSVVPGKDLRLPKIGEAHVKRLEDDIGRLSPEGMKKFVIPGGSPEAAHLQFSRAVARRAERAVVRLSRSQPVNQFVLEYLNRLSTLLYVLALSVKRLSGREEEYPTYE